MGLMEPVKVLERAASTAAHAVRHPISSTAYAVGIVRGLAGAAIHGAAVRRHHHGQAATRPHVVPQRTAPAAEQGVPQPDPDIETPAGTTDADAGHDPGTAEADPDKE